MPSDRRTPDSAKMARLGRIGAYRQQALHDTKLMTHAGREAFLSRFERDVDPELRLPPAERARRAAAAKKAHFTRLAYRSAEVRKKR